MGALRVGRASRGIRDRDADTRCLRARAENTAQAEEHLRKLPLVAAGHFSLELIELRPFVNWSMLFAQ